MADLFKISSFSKIFAGTKRCNASMSPEKKNPARDT
jgi:hypothetical protein